MAGPQPYQHFFGWQGQAIKGGFQHATGQPAPAGMGGGHAGTGAVAEQGGQAIGGHHGAGDARLVGPAGIGLGDHGGVGIGHHQAVHLLEPGGLDGEFFAEATTVLGNRSGVIAHMVTKIEGLIGRQADAALAGGDTGADRGLGRPVGNDQRLRQATHPIKLSRSSLSSDSSQRKSSGSGEAHSMRSPVVG